MVDVVYFCWSVYQIVIDFLVSFTMHNFNNNEAFYLTKNKKFSLHYKVIKEVSYFF